MIRAVQPNTRPAGRWLRLARAALIMFAACIMGLWVIGAMYFPDYAARHYTEFTPNNFWTGAQTQAALADLNWPANSLTWFWAISGTVATLINMSFVLLLLWRKSDDWFGLYLALAFLITGIGSEFIDPVLELIPALAGVFDLLGQIGWQILFIIFYLFPDGRFVPRWTRWMPLAWLGVNLPDWLFSNSAFQLPAFGLWIGMGLVFTAIGSQIYRYVWRSTPLQRQQTKWMVAVLAALFLFLAFMAPGIFRPPPEEALGPALQWALFGGALFRLSFLLLPAAILIAILRYRLWDIDLVIRRTLQYTLVTGLLGLVFFGGVTLLQGLFSSAGNEQSTISIVISTLAIAALFNPLRRRVQNFIDKRFYRQKYDAEKALAEFATSARSETDLQALTDNMLQVVQATIQPEAVSVWFMPEKVKREQ